MNETDFWFHHRYFPGQGKDSPTLLLLHGTGGTEDDLLELGAHLLPQAARLSPRGSVSENGMARFFRRFAEGIFDVDDLRQRSEDLAGFVAEAAERYGFNPGRVVAAGYSNGANIAASLLLLYPQVLAGAILFHAMVPIVPDRLPNLAGVPVFMGSGRRDRIIRPEQSEELAGLLREAGADVTLHWQEGGHALTTQEVEAATEWLDAGRVLRTGARI